MDGFRMDPRQYRSIWRYDARFIRPAEPYFIYPSIRQETRKMSQLQVYQQAGLILFLRTYGSHLSTTWLL